MLLESFDRVNHDGGIGVMVFDDNDKVKSVGWIQLDALEGREADGGGEVEMLFEESTRSNKTQQQQLPSPSVAPRGIL